MKTVFVSSVKISEMHLRQSLTLVMISKTQTGSVMEMTVGLMTLIAQMTKMTKMMKTKKNR